MLIKILTNLYEHVHDELLLISSHGCSIDKTDMTIHHHHSLGICRIFLSLLLIHASESNSIDQFKELIIKLVVPIVHIECILAELKRSKEIFIHIVPHSLTMVNDLANINSEGLIDINKSITVIGDEHHCLGITSGVLDVIHPSTDLMIGCHVEDIPNELESSPKLTLRISQVQD